VPVIDVHNVSKRFYLRYTREFLATGVLDSLFRRNRWEEFWALRNISFSIERGESLGVIGPNGSGKTTLLSIVSGVTQPTEGTVRTEGRISALLQLGAGFHPDLTGRENVYINAGVLGFNRRETDKIYPSVAEFSELGDFLEAPIRRYSSGMLARLGFSIAIHVNPDVIIIDEVLGVGDQQFQKKCHERILAFIDRGVTILIVSHAAAQVRKLCNKVLYLEQGDLAAFGDADEVLAAYAARDDKRPTIGTGAQSGPTARPKPASAVVAAAPKPPPTKPDIAEATTQPTHAAPASSPDPQRNAAAAPSTDALKGKETAPAERQAPPSQPAQEPPEKTPAQVAPDKPQPSRIRPIKGAPSARFKPSCAGMSATTFFYRNGPQVEALFDEVFPQFKDQSTIRVRCWECAIGAEPYTLAIEHDRRKISDYALAIEAFDRDPELIQGAIQAEFNEMEIFYDGLGHMPRELLGPYFTRNEDGNYLLIERVRHNVLFGIADFLSDRCTKLPPADVVLAQNVLIHLEPEQAAAAFRNVVAQTAAGGVLAVGGCDLDHLVGFAREHHLDPIEARLEEIHDGWRARRNQPNAKHGLGPLDRSQNDWRVRYCSLFQKPAAPRRWRQKVTNVLRAAT